LHIYASLDNIAVITLFSSHGLKGLLLSLQSAAELAEPSPMSNICWVLLDYSN